MANARDVRHGLGNGLRAFQDGMKEFGLAAMRVGAALKSIAVISKKFTTDTARAHYNLAGQYTFPIEQELIGSEPPSVNNLSGIGQAVLAIPVSIPIITLSLTAIPLIGNSIQSIPRGFVNVLNLAVADCPAADQIAYHEESRNPLRRVYGSPGLLIGGILGIVPTAFLGVSRILGNSFLSFPITFEPVINVMYPHDPNFIPAQAQNQRSNLAYVLGIPGLIFGAAIGIAGIIAILFARGISNSFSALIEHWKLTVNYGLPFGESYQFHSPPENRSSINYYYGFPGAILGTIFGGISALIATICISSCRFFISVVTPTITDSFAYEQVPDTRSPFAFYIGLIPGLIIGGVLGSVCGIGILATRLIYNTFKLLYQIIKNSVLSFVSGFKNTLNIGMMENDRCSNEELREPYYQWLGIVGKALGACVGFISAFLASTAITTVGVWRMIVNTTLENKFAVGNDTRSDTGKILGYLGIIIGGITGGLSALAVLLSQTFGNGSFSFNQYFKKALNLNLQQDQQWQIEEDNRSTFRKVSGFITGGIPGILLGGIATIVLGTAISTVVTFIKITNTVLHPESEITPWLDHRSTAGKYLGMLGLVFGFAGGIVGAMFAGSGRFCIQTYVSMSRYFRIVSNVGLPANSQLAVAEDNRSVVDKRLGFFGTILGSVFGAIGAVFISTIQTMWRTTVALINFPRFDLMQINLLPDQRSNFGWGLGVLGILPGIPLGLVLACIPLALRFIMHGAYFGALSFSYIANFALHPENKFIIPNEPSSVAEKCFGAPGFVIGSVLGIVSVPLITLVRVFTQSVKSWAYLSGSLLNCALGWRQFGGLARDRRSGIAKGVGCLGYVLAIATTLPIAAAILVRRKTPNMLWLGFSVTLGLVASPLVLIYKGCAAGLNNLSNGVQPIEEQQQGELNIVDQRSVMQGFKNIYSSLNAWGTFTPGDYLAQNADGSRNRWTFFRECVTFNTKSLAERTLDELLAGYKSFEREDEGGFGADFFRNDKFDEVIERVKQYYSDGCCDSAKDIAELLVEIDKIALFVKTYMTDRLNHAEVEMIDVGPPPGLPYRVLFFGEAEPGAMQEVVPDEQIRLRWV